MEGGAKEVYLFLGPVSDSTVISENIHEDFYFSSIAYLHIL